MSRPLAPGSNVSQWVVVGAIREEPGFVLYAATRGAGGPPGCLKLIDPNPLHDGAYFRYLRRAGRRWQRIHSPNLVQLTGVGKSPSGPYLATALFTGSSLTAELAAGPLDAGRVAGLALEVAGVLDAVLDTELTPGALTPRDITLTGAGALVTDPGIGRGDTGNPLIDPDAVQYLSPEEARGERLLPQSAVYSLACILHECLTGEIPYPRDQPEAVLYAHVADPPPRPSEHNTSLPPEVDPVFDRAMAAAPEERHASPGELARDLSAALGAALQPVEAQVPPERHRSPLIPRTVRRPVAVTLALLACIAAGFALGSATDSDEPPEPRASPASPASAVAAERVVDVLDGRRAALRERLVNASRRAGQAEVARRLARLYGRAEGQADGAGPDVQRALRGARRAYARLAAGASAQRNERQAWARGRAAVARADAALTRALSQTGR